MKKINVGVNLTTAYDMTWEEGHRPLCRMLCCSWIDSGGGEEARDELFRSDLSAGRPGSWSWVEDACVHDFDEGLDLPDKLYVVVYCSGVYTPEGTLRPQCGGGHGSWGVQCAFLDRDRAMEFVKNETMKWLWLWAIEVDRFVPAKA